MTLYIIFFVFLCSLFVNVHTKISPANFARAKDNIVLILTDDQDLLLNSLDYMPKLKRYMTDKGATFPNFFVPTPVCCPSRASILRGQYAHNTQIIDMAMPGGGAKRFHSLGLENSTIATWLKQIGYRTALHGKYLNQYPCNNSWVPPGWDDWFALCTPEIYNYVDSNYNENGEIKNVKEYQTETIGNRALQFIEESHSQGVPFFLHLSFIAPHAPARPAPKYDKHFLDVRLPTPDNWNQLNVERLPSFLKDLPIINETQRTQLTDHYIKRLQSLQSVDEYVEQIIFKLDTLKLLDRTYIIYTSDNGFHMGQHRLMEGKRMPYEEDIRVPFIMRGPYIPHNISVPVSTLNIDIAPTIAEITGAKIPSFVDGKSFLPFMKFQKLLENKTVDAFRPFVLLEHWGMASGGYESATWQGLRVVNTTTNIAYTSWCTFDREFYDINEDPLEINNIYGYDFDTMHDFDSILRQLYQCRSYECNKLFTPIPYAEFIPTPLTPCFDGREDSKLPDFYERDKIPPDFTYELYDKSELFPSDVGNTESAVGVPYFSMFVVLLFVLFSIYVCFTYRQKLYVQVVHSETPVPSEEEVNIEYQEGSKQVRKRQVV